MRPSPSTSFGIKKSTLVLEGRRIHRETGSPFDTTASRSELLDRPGGHILFTDAVDTLAFTRGSADRPVTSPVNPRLYLSKRSGSGGSAATLHREYASSTLRPVTSPVTGKMTMILPSLEVSGTGTFAAATSPLRGPPAAGAKS